MPVLFDSAASAGGYLDRFAGSGSVTAQLNVSPLATNVVALAAVLFTSEADTTGATFGVTFGGTAMLPFGTPSRWNSNREYLQWFILDGSATGGATVPTGARSVTASVSGVPTEPTAARALALVVGTWVNVQAVGPSTAATPTTSTSNAVTVASVLPAHRVVGVHALGSIGSGLNQYTGAPRALISLNKIASLFYYSAGATLALTDAPGAASVADAATQASTAFWGARGVSLSPVPIVAGAALSTSLVPSAGGGTYRTATPHTDRYYVIPTAAETDDSIVLGNFLESADGVRMPSWPKDPDDTLDYALDWSKHIAPDDYIVTVRYTTSSSALNVFSQNISESLKYERASGYEAVVTSCWFTGGVSGVFYEVVAHVTTAEGRQHDRRFGIMCGGN